MSYATLLEKLNAAMRFGYPLNLNKPYQSLRVDLETIESRAEIAEKVMRETFIDAACFRFWVSEAARSPGALAKLIANCTTEEDYRSVIVPFVLNAEAAISKAKEEA